MTTKAGRTKQSQVPSFGHMSKCENCGDFFNRHGRDIWTCSTCTPERKSERKPYLGDTEAGRVQATGEKPIIEKKSGTYMVREIAPRGHATRRSAKRIGVKKVGTQWSK